jgi:hypothetical protein
MLLRCPNGLKPIWKAAAGVKKVFCKPIFQLYQGFGKPLRNCIYVSPPICEGLSGTFL